MTQALTEDDVHRAADRLAGRIVRTPTIDVPGERALLSLEFLQLAGTVKYRSALNRILAASETRRVRGVVAASGGNAAVAAAYAARTMGLSSKVFVPPFITTEKVLRLAKLDAEVVQTGSDYQDAEDEALAEADAAGALFIHPYDGIDVCAGLGTLAFDLVASGIGFDTVLVPVSGGGLLAGLAVALRAAGRSDARVVGVETSGCAAFAAALAAGEIVDVPVSGIAVDGLGAPRAGAVPFEVATRLGLRSIVVGDGDALAARDELFAERRILVELSAAVAYAPLMSGAYVPEPDERVLVVLASANASRG
ncbi:pyridoxal-phosphate dependent enzyme [Tsukamurella sp. 8F]|uniref:pyridoxal-phosphate dependent enzyme n=1 Tax=unclassified Tsukamurella TaxID=2633480 RepID=UPI0023B8C796|nr:MULTISPECIES: pyridoxal-phosphate dependent enzyme [unclassified Tsukamurella]MDF0530338.1 pyridoxal-phosphate dependent enzyme [Tsukamurella sp. 8J]MDF0587635.1 pyridoxal-phosphate dependent enzyme [Tsukamurella sp. 8F]